MADLTDPITCRRAADILLGAADLIAQRGLARGAFLDERGRLCALGAMSRAAGGVTGRPPQGVDAYDAAYSAMLMSVQPWSVCTWSDRSEPTTVIATLRAAARYLTDDTDAAEVPHV